MCSDSGSGNGSGSDSGNILQEHESARKIIYVNKTPFSQ